MSRLPPEYRLLASRATGCDRIDSESFHGRIRGRSNHFRTFLRSVGPEARAFDRVRRVHHCGPRMRHCALDELLGFLAVSSGNWRCGGGGYFFLEWAGSFRWPSRSKTAWLLLGGAV